MSKAETRQIAKDFVLKHREHYRKGRAPGSVTEKEIEAAVTKIAKALTSLKSQQTNDVKATAKKSAA
jgi:hypothetical protein